MTLIGGGGRVGRGQTSASHLYGVRARRGENAAIADLPIAVGGRRMRRRRVHCDTARAADIFVFVRRFGRVVMQRFDFDFRVRVFQFQFDI